jgi:hypothetical protein
MASQPCLPLNGPPPSPAARLALNTFLRGAEKEQTQGLWSEADLGCILALSGYMTFSKSVKKDDEVHSGVGAESE